MSNQPIRLGLFVTQVNKSNLIINVNYHIYIEPLMYVLCICIYIRMEFFLIKFKAKHFFFLRKNIHQFLFSHRFIYSYCLNENERRKESRHQRWKNWTVLCHFCIMRFLHFELRALIFSFLLLFVMGKCAFDLTTRIFN